MSRFGCQLREIILETLITLITLITINYKLEILMSFYSLVFYQQTFY